MGAVCGPRIRGECFDSGLRSVRPSRRLVCRKNKERLRSGHDQNQQLRRMRRGQGETGVSMVEERVAGRCRGRIALGRSAKATLARPGGACRSLVDAGRCWCRLAPKQDHPQSQDRPARPIAAPFLALVSAPDRCAGVGSCSCGSDLELSDSLPSLSSSCLVLSNTFQKLHCALATPLNRASPIARVSTTAPSTHRSEASIATTTPIYRAGCCAISLWNKIGARTRNEPSTVAPHSLATASSCLSLGTISCQFAP